MWVGEISLGRWVCGLARWISEMGRRVGWRSREEMRVVLERKKKGEKQKKKKGEKSERERGREGERKKRRIFFLMREEREV